MWLQFIATLAREELVPHVYASSTTFNFAPKLMIARNCLVKNVLMIMKQECLSPAR